MDEFRLKAVTMDTILQIQQVKKMVMVLVVRMTAPCLMVYVLISFSLSVSLWRWTSLIGSVLSLWRLSALPVQSGSVGTRLGCSTATTAAARSPPAAPAQRIVRMMLCPPSQPACPSSRTTARSTPTLMAKLGWVSKSELLILLLF